LTAEKVASALGLIAIAGGIARILMTPFALVWGQDSMPELWAGLVACFLMAIGTLGIYMYQSVRTGKIGLIGCLLLALSNMITSCLVWSTMLQAEPSAGGGVTLLPLMNEVIMLIGVLVFSISSFQARKLPDWATLALLLWFFLGYVPALSVWVTPLWGLAYIGYGYTVWKNSSSRNKYDTSITA